MARPTAAGRGTTLLAVALALVALLPAHAAAQNATNATTTGSRALNNDTVSAYFQVPPVALYLCPYSDAATSARAFGYNLPNATLPGKLAAAPSAGDAVLAACPRAAASAGNYSGAAAAQTVSLPISDTASGSLRPETFYALLVQRKAGVRELTLTLSVKVDGDDGSVLYDREVITLSPASGNSRRRRSLLSAGGAAGAWVGDDDVGGCGDAEDDDQPAAGELQARARVLLKGSSGGGGGGGKSGGGGYSSGGGKSSGGSKSGSSGGSKSGSSGSSGKPVKTTSLVKGSSYSSKAGKAVLHWATFSKSKSKYRIKGSKHHYKTSPTKALAYGVPALFAAWFLFPPLAVPYGYTGMSLFQVADPWSYATPADWQGWENVATATAGSYVCPRIPGGGSGAGLDCWQAGSSTCCGQSYANAKFGTQAVPVGYTRRGSVLKCGLRNDLVLALPVYLPSDGKVVQVQVHSLEAKLAPSTCGSTNQTLDPTGPAVYLSMVQLETVNTSAAAARYSASASLAAAAAALVALLFAMY